MENNFDVVKKSFRGSNFNYGFYAWMENDKLVIGDEKGREGGILYRGEYKGDDTPYLKDIKKENTTLYNSIVRYFNEKVNDHKNAVMTDMEKLNEIFSINKEDVKKQFPQLYYAILAVLDKEKKPHPSGYFYQ